MFTELLRDAVDFHADLVRNIKGIRLAQNLFDDLSQDPLDQRTAMAAEAAGFIESSAPLVTRPFDYGAVVTYPFVSFNGQATRFSDGLAYGIWYGSIELETTVYETVFHWHRFVMDSFAGEDREIQGERRVLDTRCDAILLDLRGKERRERRLVDRRDYSFTHALGRYLKAQSQNGVIVASARCRGTNAAVFRPQVLSNPRDRCFLTYRMNPTQDSVRVERQPKRLWLSIKPSTLR
ncbi:MAG: RES family NAD+ phosphorylase [Burkholderiales bacterium]|nr:RES family NAD+ phosphorylase [Burkholderiales bacterium]